MTKSMVEMQLELSKEQAAHIKQIHAMIQALITLIDKHQDQINSLLTRVKELEKGQSK